MAATLVIPISWKPQTTIEIGDLASEEIVNCNYPGSITCFSISNHIGGPYGTHKAFGSSCGEITPGGFLLEIFENGTLLYVTSPFWRPHMIHVETNGTISFDVTVIPERSTFKLYNPKMHQVTVAVGVMWNSGAINTIVEYAGDRIVYKTSGPETGFGLFAWDAKNFVYGCVGESQVKQFAIGNLTSTPYYEGGAWTFLYGFGCLSTSDPSFGFVVAGGQNRDVAEKMLGFSFDLDAATSKAAWTLAIQSFGIDSQIESSERRLVYLRLYQLLGSIVHLPQKTYIGLNHALIFASASTAYRQVWVYDACSAVMFLSHYKPNLAREVLFSYQDIYKIMQVKHNKLFVPDGFETYSAQLLEKDIQQVMLPFLTLYFFQATGDREVVRDLYSMLHDVVTYVFETYGVKGSFLLSGPLVDPDTVDISLSCMSNLALYSMRELSKVVGASDDYSKYDSMLMEQSREIDSTLWNGTFYYSRVRYGSFKNTTSHVVSFLLASPYVMHKNDILAWLSENPDRAMLGHYYGFSPSSMTDLWPWSVPITCALLEKIGEFSLRETIVRSTLQLLQSDDTYEAYEAGGKAWMGGNPATGMMYPAAVHLYVLCVKRGFQQGAESLAIKPILIVNATKDQSCRVR